MRPGAHIPPDSYAMDTTATQHRLKRQTWSQAQPVFSGSRLVGLAQIAGENSDSLAASGRFQRWEGVGAERLRKKLGGHRPVPSRGGVLVV